MSAYFGAGIAQGSAAVADYERGREMRDINLQAARLQLKQQQDLAPLQQSQAELELEQQKLQLKQLQQQQFKRDTYDAFRLYSADGDTRHLNSFLANARTSPVAGSLFGNVARVDRLADTPEHAKMLAGMGIEDAKGLIANPELSSNLVVATMNDGTQQLVDMERLYAGTGFTQQMASEELELMSKRALAISRLTKGSSVEKLSARERVAKQMAEDLGIPEWEAYEQLGSKDTTQSTTETERMAKALMEQDPSLDYIAAMEKALGMKRAGTEAERAARLESERTGKPYEQALEEQIKYRNAPNSIKESAYATEAADALDEQFSGKFFETDFTKPENRRVAARYIRDLEAASPVKLSEEQKKYARQMRQLVNLGGRAGTAITPEETGIIDSLLSDFRSYVSDDVTGGKQGVAAYESFRNIVRNALFGSALTNAEIEAFNKAAGTLRQQQGPVLAKFQEQLRIVRDGLKSVYDSQDPYLAHYYMGGDLEQVQDVIGAIDSRLDLIARRTKNATKASPTVKDATKRKPLNEIFGSN